MTPSVVEERYPGVYEPYPSPGLTPPTDTLDLKRAREDDEDAEDMAPEERTTKRRKTSQDTRNPLKRGVREHQEVLLLHAPKQRYALARKHRLPTLKHDHESLVEVQAVGLNPIDWKGPDYGFGLPPDLPCISGRDLAGKVVKAPKADSRIKEGDIVMGISTDYRDSRKSAYQEYAVVSDFNAVKLPSHVSQIDAAPLGVAYVAAVLALGICMGIDFSSNLLGTKGPDLLHIIRSLDPEVLPKDIREECMSGIDPKERPKPGDWIVIWGGSSTTGCVALQLAKMAGLKVIAVLDIAKNGERLLKHGADLLVDRLDTERALSIVRGITKGKLRFGLDCGSKESAKLLAMAMRETTQGSKTQAHLVGLSGLPKEKMEGVKYHTVPIKAFHEAPAVGESMCVWLENMLKEGTIATPDIEIFDGGLEGINDALDKLRDGTVSGPRIVVPL